MYLVWEGTGWFLASALFKEHEYLLYEQVRCQVFLLIFCIARAVSKVLRRDRNFLVSPLHTDALWYSVRYTFPLPYNSPCLDSHGKRTNVVTLCKVMLGNWLGSVYFLHLYKRKKSTHKQIVIPMTETKSYIEVNPRLDHARTLHFALIPAPLL